MEIEVHAKYSKEKPTSNLVWLMRGADPALRDEYVVVGAHLDHVGGQAGAVYAPGAYGAFLPENAPTAYYVVSGLFVVVAATVKVADFPSATVWSAGRSGLVMATASAVLRVRSTGSMRP